MNTKSKCIALACLLAGLSGVGWGQTEKDDALSLKVDEIVRAEMREQKVPGVALAVMRNGKIVKAAGYGLANVELNVPVTPESLFHTESVGKTFTATAVMMLVEEGKVGLDDKISKYLPGAPPVWDGVTIRHLLSHTSGIPDYVGNNGDPIYDLRHDLSEQELIHRIASETMKFPPGEKRSYSNSGYVILGVIIRRVTGKFWFDYVQERIFNPLGMTSARLISNEDIIPNRVSGYVKTQNGLQNEPYIASSFRQSADGELCMSVLDMAKWDAALYTGKLLKRSTLEQMWTLAKLKNGTDTAYNGLGWFTAKASGHRLVWHDGVGEAFTTGLYRYVDDSLSVAVLVNLGPDDEAAMPGSIADKVAALYVPALGKSQVRTTVTDSPKLRLFGPAAEEMLLGSWSINARATAAEKNLGEGAGTEIWYAGPGGNSIIEELHAKDPQGRPIDAFGPSWWDNRAGGQRFIWCANTLADGCSISQGVIRWVGERSVYDEEILQDGKKSIAREVFSDITAHSFTQTLSEGPSEKETTPTWTAQATKLASELPRLQFPARALAGNAGEASRAPVKQLVDAFAGTWSIKLSFAPNKEMPKGGGGEGEETWRAGPGSYSLIEEYHSVGADGEVLGLGILWPDANAKEFRVLWCDNTLSPGCRVLNHDAEWKEGRLTISEKRRENGKETVFREVFMFDTPNSFTQTLEAGDAAADLKPFLTIRATRKSSDSTMTHEARALSLTAEQREVLEASQNWLVAFNRRDLDKFASVNGGPEHRTLVGIAEPR